MVFKFFEYSDDRAGRGRERWRRACPPNDWRWVTGATVSKYAREHVHGAGRVPDLAGLEPEAAGVEVGRRGVKLNEYLQSVSNSAVYAAGAAAEIWAPLTPWALPEYMDFVH